MPETLCQQALERVLTYLRDSGLELSRETCRQSLRLVNDAMTDGDGPDLPARCIERLPEYFELPGVEFPLVAPPLKRGHIGYYPYD